MNNDLLGKVYMKVKKKVLPSRVLFSSLGATSKTGQNGNKGSSVTWILH
jgi:hypothetical protein